MNLRCHFNYVQRDFQLHVDLTLKHNLLGILGPSGSGKSTFL